MEFEDKIKELQIITEKFEDSSLSLDEGLKLYEKGMTLAKECFTTLNEVKGKVNVIKKDLEKYKEESLD